MQVQKAIECEKTIKTRKKACPEKKRCANVHTIKGGTEKIVARKFGFGHDQIDCQAKKILNQDVPEWIPSRDVKRFKIICYLKWNYPTQKISTASLSNPSIEARLFIPLAPAFIGRMHLHSVYSTKKGDHNE